MERDFGGGLLKKTKKYKEDNISYSRSRVVAVGDYLCISRAVMEQASLFQSFKTRCKRS